MDDREFDALEPGPPPGFDSLDAYRAWVEALIAGDPGFAEDQAGFAGWTDGEEHGVPPEPVPVTSGLGITVSLGDAAGIDPGLLAAMTGPDGLRGEGLGPQFGQHAPADALSPSPVLAAVTEQASAAGVGRLSDDELIGVLRASVRLANREGGRQQLLIAEFARRRQAAKDAETAANGGRVSCRSGEFPGEELAMELLTSPLAAAARIETAQDLAGRLPATFAAMLDGLIDPYRGQIIAGYTHFLTGPDAATADEILSRFALGRRADALARKAAAMEMKLAPDAVKARREAARRDFQRVEARREKSGNASLSGRELDTAGVIASKAHLDAVAAKLRAAGVGGTLDALRALAFLELTQGLNPLDHISPTGPTAQPDDRTGPGPDRPSGTPGGGGLGRPGPVGPPPAGGGPAGTGPAGGGPADTGPAGGAPADGGPGQPSPVLPTRWGPGDPGWDEDPDDDRHGTPPRRDPAPLPALINLLIPVGSYLGWSTAPGQAAGWGLLDRQEISDLLGAAARHPRTRWCATLVGPDGTAVAHACAKGQHPWLADAAAPPPADVTAPPGPPGPPGGPGAGHPRPGSRDGPDPQQAARLAALIARLGLTFRPVARGGCDHGAAEDRYTPSRSLRHLVRARTGRCDAPGCQAQAVHGDLDHTIEYPAGLTCQCNLGPKCRRHHRCKQAPGWKLEQTEPGVMTWTLPSGRVHTTTPTVYDI